ncbi:hypothetical protein FRB94_008986 [Tulasnella sp. JGI-2019a]|nr:hypothetical protein FRB94_008986 [Tulasnella sp. JGI-2019a]
MAETSDIALSHGEVEHTLISTSLEIEELDLNLFRSKSLYLPTEARGVFGGQVISQALLAATTTVDASYAAHSLHCYFLLSAKATVPILYLVDRVRQGKTYATRAVKAVQSGQVVFIMLCSFQIPEPALHKHQWPFPSDVPDPDKCETALQRFQRLASHPGMNGTILDSVKAQLNDRMKSPIEHRLAKRITSEHGTTTAMHWMRARNAPKYEAPYQKAILAYLSDLQLLGQAAQTQRLSWFYEYPNKLGMMSTIDHAIWYYDHDFDCSDWLLYIVESSASDMGRALVHGRLYTKAGKLVAVVSQEGVVRAAPQPKSGPPGAKM